MADGNFKISPALFDLRSKSGNILQAEIVIENSTESPIVFESTIRTNNELSAQDIEFPSDWISTPQEAQVPANGEITVPMTIEVPTSTRPGGYYLEVVFTPAAPTDTGVNVSPGLSTQVLLEVEGVPRTETTAEITKFQTASSSYNTPDVEFQIEVESGNNYHFKPRGSITITGPSGNRLSNGATFNDKFVYLLPEMALNETVGWQPLNYDPIFPVGGDYSAELVIIDSDSGKVLDTQTTNFTIIPIWHTVSLIIALAALCLIAIVGYRRFRSK